MSAKMTVSNLDDSRHLHEFRHVLAGRQAGNGRPGRRLPDRSWVPSLSLRAIAVIILGVWGYFVPAIIRINYFSTSQVLIVIGVMLTITPLTALLLKSAKTTTEMVWGKMPPRAGLLPLSSTRSWSSS